MAVQKVLVTLTSQAAIDTFTRLSMLTKTKGSSPTFVYMSGGPGLSSVGEIYINGPCVIDEDDEDLAILDANELCLLCEGLIDRYSWTKTANGIYIDSPGETGFSLGPTEVTMEQQVENLINKMEKNESAFVEIAKASHTTPEGHQPDPEAYGKVARAFSQMILHPLKDRRTSPYDVRTAPGEERDQFYFPPEDSTEQMNRKSIQAKLGVDKKWTEREWRVTDDFGKYLGYDTSSVVPELLDEGLKLFVFNGEEDYMTSCEGALSWMSKLKGKEDYGKAITAAVAKPIEFDEVDDLGTIRQAKFTTGGSLSFIQ
ncbi:hypothetical protein FOZ60_001069, partial [Perkinsus olseni]